MIKRKIKDWAVAIVVCALFTATIYRMLELALFGV